ncbi:MAG: hypothetical protein IPK59_22120 [Rhodospirillaceae bacterium]|nr:hypothetical protein [Rhodospirillaceae bacterium]
MKVVNPDINFLQATSSGCKPVLEQAGEKRCRELMDMIFHTFLPNNRVDTIVLAARWKPEDLPFLKVTLSRLTEGGENVIVFGPRVEYKHDLPWILALSILKDNMSLIDGNRRIEQKATDELFRRELAGMNIPYFSLYQAICADSTCRTTDDAGTPLAFDYGHFTDGGSIFIADKVKAWGGFK